MKQKLSFDFTNQPFSFSIPEKITAIKKETICPELNRFRQELDTSPGNLYELHKRHATIYRWIFLSFALIFISLATLLYYQTTNGFLFIYHGNLVVIKNFFIGISAFISVASATIAFHIRPEREAVWHVARQAVRELTKHYMHRCSEWGWQRFFPFFPSYDKVSMLRLSFRTHLDKIKEVRGSSLVLIDKIANSKNLEAKERMMLFDQAIQELKENLQVAVNKFRC